MKFKGAEYYYYIITDPNYKILSKLYSKRKRHGFNFEDIYWAQLYTHPLIRVHEVSKQSHDTSEIGKIFTPHNSKEITIHTHGRT